MRDATKIILLTIAFMLVVIGVILIRLFVTFPTR